MLKVAEEEQIEVEEQEENGSNSGVKHQRPSSYNKPNRRQALFSIRKMIVEQGLSHAEIQLQLDLPASTYFRYLDQLFEVEQQALEGSNYTWKYLHNESQILYQRYLEGARQFKEIASDKTVDAEFRIAALDKALDYQRAAHDICYYAPSYLVAQGLILPTPKRNHPGLTMSRQHLDEKFEEVDPSEKERIKVAGMVRMLNVVKEHAAQREQQQETDNQPKQ